jgi:hypothetical protein
MVQVIIVKKENMREYELKAKIQILARESQGYKELINILVPYKIEGRGKIVENWVNVDRKVISLSKRLKGMTDTGHLPELKEFFVRNHINISLV